MTSIHRPLFALSVVALTLGGASLGGCDAPTVPPARPATSQRPRAPAPRVTAQAVAAFEREVSAMVASGGGGDTAALRGAWRNIFTSCTMQGEAHERLHEFLEPMMRPMSQIDAPPGGRLSALRAMQRQLGLFDERFVVTP